MTPEYRQALLQKYYEILTPERVQRIESISLGRTRFLTVALENIYQPHNASAVLRSCDGFGVQDVHVIEDRNRFQTNSGVTIGADQWLSLHRYNHPDRDNSAGCVSELRRRGYRIVATTPHREGYVLSELPVDRPLALVFGTERMGLTAEMLAAADEYVQVPMLGFSESFNISVFAALCLYDLTTRIRTSDTRWRLSDDELLDLRLDWARKSSGHPAELESRFLQELGV